MQEVSGSIPLTSTKQWQARDSSAMKDLLHVPFV
jgi:hypothetical protein